MGESDDEYSWGTLTPEAVQTEDPELDILSHYRADVYLDGLLLPATAAEPIEPALTSVGIPGRNHMSGRHGLPQDTAVESVSWGRIKAALEMEQP